MEVPDNTEIVCGICGDVYSIKDTESHDKYGKRVCKDCLEGISIRGY